MLFAGSFWTLRLRVSGSQSLVRLEVIDSKYGTLRHSLEAMVEDNG